MAEGFSFGPGRLTHTFSIPTTTDSDTMSGIPGGPFSPTGSPSDTPGGSISNLPQSSGNPGGPNSPASDPNASATPIDSLTTSPPPMTFTTPTTTPTVSAVGAVSTHRSHAGAIAGAVVGVLAALALLGLFGLCLRRRRQRAGVAALASPPLDGGRYTEPKPRSRPSSRIAAAPMHNAQSASVGTIESFSASRTQDSHATMLGEARTFESHGTLADAHADEDAFLEKLEAAEAPIVGSLPALPAAAPPHSGVRNRRSVGETLVVADHAYTEHHTRSARTRSQDLSARVPVPTSPTYPPSSPTDVTSPRARKMPRKKPVPRYSADGAPQVEPGSTPPEPSSPFTDATPRPFHDGRPVHYLIPDMPAPQR